MQNTTNVPQVLNVFYTGLLIERALAFRQFEKFADFSRDIPQKSGQVIRWRKYAALPTALTPLTEGVTPSGNSSVPTNIDATVAEYGDYIKHTDVLEYTEDDGVLQEDNKLLAEQVADTFDILTANVLVGGTQVQRVNDRSTRGAVVAADYLVAATVDKALRTLHHNKAKPIKAMMDGSPNYGSKQIAAAYIGIVHDYIEKDITSTTSFPGFVPVEEYANKGDVMEGEIGKYKDVRWIRSENMPVFEGEGDSGIDVYPTLILARNAYGLTKLSGKSMEVIIKSLGYGEDPLNQRGSMGWKGFFVCKIIDELNVMRLESSKQA